MIRNFKALGLALVALVALGALAASSASAAGETFHSQVEKTISTGTSENTHVFTAGSFSVECTHAEFKGTQLGTTVTEVTVHPIYTGCTSSLGTSPVDTTGCNYVFDSVTNAGGHLPVSIECTPGFSIKVTAPGCTVSFGSQVTTGGVKATNLGSGSTADVTIDATTTATFTKSGIGCFAISGTSGTYTGLTTVKGYVDNGVTGNIDEDVDGTIYHEGAQVGVSWG